MLVVRLVCVAFFSTNLHKEIRLQGEGEIWAEEGRGGWLSDQTPRSLAAVCSRVSEMWTPRAHPLGQPTEKTFKKTLGFMSFYVQIQPRELNCKSKLFVKDINLP